MIAIFKHELKSYFHSLTAYVFGAFLLAVVGFGAVLCNIQAAFSNFELVFSFSSLVFVIIVPILTMRTIAEERRQKTDQLLYSLPVTTTEIVLGKYLALLVVYLVPLCIISGYPLIFSLFGDVYLLTSYGSMLAFFLLGAAFIAVGVFLSSVTENQLIAAVSSIAIIGMLILISFLADEIPVVWVRTVIDWFSVMSRYAPFTNGLLDISAIIYYIRFAAVFLFLTVRVYEKRRWS